MCRFVRHSRQSAFGLEYRLVCTYHSSQSAVCTQVPVCTFLYSCCSLMVMNGCYVNILFPFIRTIKAPELY